MEETSSAAPPEGVSGAPLVEFRLHGIGKHAEWSALGRPRVVLPNPSHPLPQEVSPPGETVRVARPPDLSERPVYLMNWSRTSSHWGRTVTALWYVATPYTLVNVARHMRADPAHQRSPRALRALESAGTHTTGLLLTALTLIWLVAIAETAGRLRPFARAAGERQWGTALVVLVLVLLLATIVARRRRATIETGTPTALAHGLVLVLTAGALLAQPMQLLMRAERPPRALLPLFSPVPAQDFQSWCRVEDLSTPACLSTAASGDTLLYFFDPLAATSFFALLAVSLIAVAHYVVGTIVKAPNVAGAGLALAAATVIFLGFASALRVALEWLVHYANGYLAWLGPAAPAFTRTVMPPHLTAVTREAGTQFASDTLPLYGITGLVALALIYPVLYQLEKRRLSTADRPENKKVLKARVRHLLLRNLPSTLAPALTASAVLCLVFWTLLYTAITTPWPALTQLTQFLLHLSYVAALLVFVLHRFVGPLDAILGKLADIVGFWPARHHVFAGVSYRDGVVAELDQWMRDLAPHGSLLVAHSQGSVIAAWALSQDVMPLTRVHLVTCGCPLDTLYTTFFPAEFTPGLRKKLVSSVEGWRNHWRDTDLIASPCDRGEDDVRLDDDPPIGPPNGHSHYWNDPQHVQEIDHWLTTFTSEGQGSSPVGSPP